jgi:hypothetical protein
MLKDLEIIKAFERIKEDHIQYYVEEVCGDYLDEGCNIHFKEEVRTLTEDIKEDLEAYDIDIPSHEIKEFFQDQGQGYVYKIIREINSELARHDN